MIVHSVLFQYSAPPEGIKASARHILVKSPQEVDMVLEKLKDDVKFADVAADFSTCPSASQGGSLGSFSPGTMVGELTIFFLADSFQHPVVGPSQPSDERPCSSTRFSRPFSTLNTFSLYS